MYKKFKFMKFPTKLLVTFCCMTIILGIYQNKAKGNAESSFVINAKTIGIIKDKKTKKILGSAFIVGAQQHLITCAHVATKGDFVYRGIAMQEDVNLKSVYFLPKYDLSVFSLAKPIDGDPLKFGDIKRVRPGDTIIYIGCDKNLLKMKHHKALVSSVGSAINKGTIIDFLEFKGKGIPGYSGAPVFDRKGNVIAILREGWNKKGIKGGKPILMNRAFSTEILSILDSEIYSIKANDEQVPTDSSALKSLIGITN